MVADSAAVCLSWGSSPVFFYRGATAPTGPGPPHFRHFAITFRHTTLCKTPRDEWSARRRDIFLITHNTHNRQTSVPPPGFEPAIPASERPQTYALDRAATQIGASSFIPNRRNRPWTNAPEIRFDLTSVQPCLHFLRL